MSFARNAQDQEHLIECVRRALACIDAGEEVVPEDLCREHPHLLGALAEVLGLSRELPLLQQAALREDPLAGALLAQRYRLVACLGRGAMGVVYRGEDEELRRAVAIKILDVRLFRDPDAELRFAREAEALASLQHANVVAIFDRGRTPEGIHFLVMELLDGITVSSLLDAASEQAHAMQAVLAVLEGPPPENHWPRLCARWALELANGLAVAHARGLVHRDVKPSNIFVTRSARPVLLDFGIAARDSDARLTATRTTIGTPWYMPPEQVRAGGATFGSAQPTLDVYGLGATLYHLLAGRAPYEGDAAAVLAALPHVDPPPLSRLQPQLPRDLVAIVDKCLERDPRRRYATGSELARDLDAFLQHQPVVARPLSSMVRRWRSWRRAPARPIAALAVMLVLLIAAIATPIVWRDHERARQRQKAELLATLPSLLAIEGWPGERVLTELRPEHQHGIQLLDRMLDLDPADVPMRLFRACLELDLGDRGAAAADLAHIASNTDSPYLRALAERYRAASPDVQGAAAVRCDGLPAPETPIECYVAGFHELRNSNVEGFAARADVLLAAAAPQYLPARDFRLFSLAALADGSVGDEKKRLLTQLYGETVALEEIYGGKTARTCAMRGVALLLERRYEDCIADFERSLQLRPERHGPHQNLGIAFLALGELDLCEQHLRAALRIHPFAWNTRQTLARLERARGNFDKASEWANGLEKQGARGEQWKQPDVVAGIELAKAMALRGVDEQGSIAAAQQAVAAYDEELAVRDSSKARLWRQLAVAMLDAKQVPFVPLVQVVLAAKDNESADNPYMLADVAHLLPVEGLDARQTAFVAALLRRVGVARAGGDEALKQRLKQEIEHGLRPWK